RAIGEVGQRIIQALKVGIIGLGGIGSIVIEQLARVGVSDFVLIDPDTIESSNISRIVGSTAKDIEKPKTEEIRKHIQDLGARSVAILADSALRQEVLMSLRDRDIVFSCV